MHNPIFRSAGEWPVAGEYDVVVIGAGPGGIGAAIAAARLGQRTLIVDKHGAPGGVATNCCCPYLMGYGEQGQQIIGGVAEELAREMARLGFARFAMAPTDTPDPEPIGNRPLLGHIIIFNDGYRVLTNRMLAAAGVDRLFYTTCLGAEVDGRMLRAVAVDRVDGPALVRAKTFVDASGDAHLVWRAGGAVRECPVEEAMTKTLLLRLGGVKNFHKAELRQHYTKLVDEGHVPFSAQDAFMGIGLLAPDEALINFTLVAGDGLRSDDLTRMDGELREQALVTLDFFRREIPGFQDAYLVEVAPDIGVRAGRGIVGLATITQVDLVENTPVDEPVALAMRTFGGHGVRSFFNAGQVNAYGIRAIPWKSLLPVSFDNVVAGGRAISSDPHITTAFRFMPRCMAIGQAAGVTAALAAQAQTRAADLGYPVVRAALLAQGAILEAAVTA